MIDLFVKTSGWYWLFTVIVSVYHTVRGYHVYRNWVELQPEERSLLERPREPKKSRFMTWKESDRKIFLYFQTALVYAVFSLAGFLALLAAYSLLSARAACDPIDAGRAGLIGFLALFGVVGVSGELPPLIQRGSFPRI